MSQYYKFNCGIGTTYPSTVSGVQYTQKKVMLMNTTPDFTYDNVYDFTLVDTGYMKINVPGDEHIYLNYALNGSEYSGTYDTNGAKSLIISADGGSVGPFRWIIISTSGMGGGLAYPLCAYDYGASITLNDGQNLKINFNNANKVYLVK